MNHCPQRPVRMQTEHAVTGPEAVHEARHRCRRQRAVEEAGGLVTAIHGEIAGQQRRP